MKTNLIPSLKPLCILAVIICLIPLSAESQWKKLFQFPKPVHSIYFMDDEGKPNIGLVGLRNEFPTLPPNLIWRTTDSGATWKESVTPRTSYPMNFTFKDSLIGWVASFNNVTDASWSMVTHDGGLHWDTLDRFFPCIFLEYHKADSLLINSSDAGTWVSKNNGVNWTKAGGSEDGPMICSFSNDLTGITTSIVIDTLGYFYYTTDGGFNWTLHRINEGIDAIKALPIKNTTTFFEIGKNYLTNTPNVVFRTDDGGLNWKFVSALSPSLQILRYMQGDLSKLFLSTDSGVYISWDQGVSWKSIGGPITHYDHSIYRNDNYSSRPPTSLYVLGNRVYAPDDSGGIWYLDASTLAVRPSSAPSFETYRLYPNPVSKSANATLLANASISEFIHIDIIDVLGRTIDTQIENAASEAYKIKAPSSPGIYYVRITAVKAEKILPLLVTP